MPETPAVTIVMPVEAATVVPPIALPLLLVLSAPLPTDANFVCACCVCACVGSVTVCVCETTTASALPPVAPTAYVEPAPTTNLFRRSGVLDVPSHNKNPLGIEAVLPDQSIIMPDTNAACIVGKAPAPLLVSTCPAVPTEAID